MYRPSKKNNSLRTKEKREKTSAGRRGGERFLALMKGKGGKLWGRIYGREAERRSGGGG